MSYIKKIDFDVIIDREFKITTIITVVMHACKRVKINLFLIFILFLLKFLTIFQKYLEKNLQNSGHG